MAIAGSYRNALNQLGGRTLMQDAYLRDLLPEAVGFQVDPSLGNLQPPAPPFTTDGSPGRGGFDPERLAGNDTSPDMGAAVAAIMSPAFQRRKALRGALQGSARWID